MALTQQQRDQYITSLFSRTGPISVEQAKQNWDSMNTEGGGASWDDVYARLNAKSDADLIGSATAHGQHLESDVRGGNALERALQSPWTYVLPGLGLSAAGMGWVGTGLGATAGETLAPWGTGEAVSGTYGVGTGATELGVGGAGVGYGGAEALTTPIGQGSGVAYGGAAGTAAEGAGSAAGAAGTGAATIAKGTALSRILAGSGTSDDYLQLAGQVGPSLLSAYGSKVQADQFGNLANRYESYGAPYRQNLADITNDPSKFYDSPGATKATDAILRRLSIAGNPAGNPYSQALGVDALYKEYGTERDRQAGYGGLTAYNQATPGLAAGAIGAQGTVYSDLGYGVGNVLAPKKTLAQQLAEYKAAGGMI